MYNGGSDGKALVHTESRTLKRSGILVYVSLGMPQQFRAITMLEFVTIVMDRLVVMTG